MDELDAWLAMVIPHHERLTSSVKKLIESLLKNASIDYLDISGRTKDISGIKEKIIRKDYSNPSIQMTDISGIRIITFLERQVDQICELIRTTFNVRGDDSFDKSSLLGNDRIGYRSVHFVCDLGEKRTDLPEYKNFVGYVFEIQVRTVLQHAWAELSHDRNYKFKGTLPNQIHRQLNLFAGLLEIADAGLQEISDSIDEYQTILFNNNKPVSQVDQLTPLILTEYLRNVAAKNNIPLKFSSAEILNRISEELRNFGVNTIADLDKLFDDYFLSIFKKYLCSDTDHGTFRDAMMFKDLQRYFEVSWSGSWTVSGTNTLEFLSEKYEAGEANTMFQKYNIKIVNNSYLDYSLFR